LQGTLSKTHERSVYSNSAFFRLHGEMVERTHTLRF
jgi:hypothetical protein